MDISILPYENGTEHMLANIHVQAYSKYNGFVPKDGNAWHWLFVRNPVIGSKRIFIARKKGELVGYYAYGLNHPLFPRKGIDGLVYDVCVGKGVVGARQIAKALVCHCIQQMRKEKFNKFAVVVPRDNNHVRKAFAECGFEEHGTQLMMGARIVNPSVLLPQLWNYARERTKQTRPFNIIIKQDFSARVFKLGDSGEQTIKLDLPQSKKKPVTIVCGIILLSDILFCQNSAMKAIFEKKMLVSPYNAIPAAIQLFKDLRLSGAWFMPSIDWR